MPKRNSKGTVIEPSSSCHLLGEVCLPLTPRQLREIWSYDVNCGNELMGAPNRTCTSEESNDNFPENSSFSESDMTNLKVVIRNMWEKAASIFEVYSDPKSPELGYRLRVKKNIPIKVTFRAQDAFFFGWCATAPANSPCSHLYNRSPVDPCGYMGGPASFMNWTGETRKQCSAALSRPTTRLSRHFARLECRNLSSGTELTWNYGCSKKMPTIGDWFQDVCCTVIINPEHSLQRQQRKSSLVPFMNIESCTLCGVPFACDNKERKLQRKPHYINSHADFLGSNWDGLLTYKEGEVDGLHVLQEADKLNCILNVLTKDLRWSILPACKVLSADKQAGYGDNAEALLEEFTKRTTMLRSYGMLVLRGVEILSPVNTPTTIQHLQPIHQSLWKSLVWKTGTKPKPGSYAVPKQHEADHAASLQAVVTEYCMKNFQS